MNTAFAIAAVLAVAWMIYQRRGDTSPAEARRLVSEGARLVDVRSRTEYASGHIDGAINVPLDEIASRLRDVGAKEKPVVVYCLSGGRSARAAAILKNAGYSNVHNLGSMSRW